MANNNHYIDDHLFHESEGCVTRVTPGNVTIGFEIIQCKPYEDIFKGEEAFLCYTKPKEET